MPRMTILSILEVSQELEMGKFGGCLQIVVALVTRAAVYSKVKDAKITRRFSIPYSYEFMPRMTILYILEVSQELEKGKFGGCLQVTVALATRAAVYCKVKDANR